MITHRRPDYLRLSLPRLLESCDDRMRIWLWHNGNDGDTLALLDEYVSHPSVYRFHHSRENVGLNAPTNWLWENSDASLLGKVDDDCLVDFGWAGALARAHNDYDRFGVLGLWRFYPEDYVPELAEKKIARFPGGHRVLQNFWVQGSGYLMKRSCIERQGLLQPQRSFTNYCIDLALKGYVNGWIYPFLREEHFDDPRSPYSALRSDTDLVQRAPLSVARSGARTLEDWQAQMRRSAWEVQAASIDPRHYKGWRKQLMRAQNAIAKLLRPSGRPDRALRSSPQMPKG
jgi:cellulose synthase/poly-beta-1,6-N-acetylglucosamine synthase-like glycosyltransferase